MFHRFTKGPSYFSQIRNQDIRDLNFLCELVLVQYVEGLALC